LRRRVRGPVRLSGGSGGVRRLTDNGRLAAAPSGWSPQGGNGRI